jgi:hypothetical protein
MSEKENIEGVKRIPTKNGTAWVWCASQLTRKSKGFRPRTERLWVGHGAIPFLTLCDARRRASRLSAELREWLVCADRRVSKRRGFVYFLRGQAAVKIGYSENPQRRVAHLQRQSPESLELVGVVAGSILLEQYFHRRFRKYRLHGEWFAHRGELARFLGTLDCSALGRKEDANANAS